MLRQDLPGVERDLLPLTAREPKNWRVQRSLGSVYRYLGRIDEALQAFQRARDFAGGRPIADADLVNALLRSHRHAEAEAVVANALAQRTSGRLRAFGLMLLTQWRGDLVAALGRDEEGVASATFDLDFLATHRAAWGFFRDRRPDLYGALAAPRPA